MNIVVIGLGSMGKRRIRLIKEMYPEYSIIGIDGQQCRREEATKLFNIECKNSLSDIDDILKINVAFVCTSPLSHASIIKECLENKWDVFTELNLVDDSYKENITLASMNNCKLFLSSTFLYREEIKYISSKIEHDKQWNYIYHVGQYLPDWHPWENYKDFFIGDKKTNGCREIMAIELPWLISAFGNVVEYYVMSDKNTNLNIDYHDNYIIQLKHESGNKGTLIVDVVSPCAVRKLEVYSEERYIQWDGIPESLREFNPNTRTLDEVIMNEQSEHREGYRAFVVENAYRNEINEFFDVVLNNKKPLYDFEKDLEILQLIGSFGA